MRIAFVAFAFLSVFATPASAQSVPIFNFHPLSKQIVAGGTSYFTAGVTGNPTPALRWQRLPAGSGVWLNLDNSVVFSGVTTQVFAVVTSDQSMSGDQFRCAATNSFGTVVSNSALLTVTPATPPSIATNPANATAKESQSVSYSCYAASATSGPLTVRWQRLPFGGNTWNDLTAGGNYGINTYGQSSYLSASSVVLAMNGDKFRCVFTNVGGSATSAEALLTVNPADPMVISGLPPTISLSYGATLLFSPTVAGTSPYTVQWFKGGLPIPYAASNSYVKGYIKPEDNGVYTVAITNITGTTTSSPVTVTVAGPVLPTVTSQPASQEYSKGAQGGVWVGANGSPTLTYQWFKNGVAISGATGTGVTFGSIGFADAGEYFVKVTNDAGTVSSATAVLTVLPPPPPSFPSWGGLGTSTLSADVPQISLGLPVRSPGPNATYQWYKDGIVIPGATQGMYYKYPANEADAGLYSVAVTNESGMAMSQELMINAPPKSTTPPWTAAVRLDDLVYFLAKDPGRIMRYDLAGNAWLPTVNLTSGKVPTAMLPTADGVFISYDKELVRRSLDLQTETPVATSSATIGCLFSVGAYIYYYDAYSTIRSRDRVSLTTGPNSTPTTDSYVLGQATPPLYVASAHKLVTADLNSGPHHFESFSVANDGIITFGASTHNNIFDIGSRWFLSADQTLVFDTGGMAFSTSDFSYQGSLGLPFDDLALLPGGELAVLREKSVMKHSGGGLVETGRTQLASAGRNLFVRGSSLYVFSDPAVGGGVPGVTRLDVSALQRAPLPVPASPVERKFSIENCFIDANGVVSLVSRTEKALIRWNAATHDFVPTVPLHGPPVRSSYDGSVDRFVAHYRDGTLGSMVPGSVPEEVAFANVPLNSPAWELVTMEDRTLATITDHPASGTRNIVLDSHGHVTQNSSDIFVEPDPWWYWNAAARRVYLHHQYVTPEPHEFGFVTVPQSNVVPSLNTVSVVNDVPIAMMRAGTAAGLLLLGQEIRSASLALVGTLANPVADGEWLGNSLFTIRVRPAGTEIQRWAADTYVKTGSLTVSGVPLRIFRVDDDTLVVVTLIDGYVAFHLVPATLTSPASYHNGPVAGVPPTILIPPQNAMAYVPNPVTFTVAVSSANPVAYQWQKNGVNIPGATGASYTIASLGLGDAGSYTVVATNSVGSSISNAGVLAVQPTVAPSDAIITITVE